MASLLIYYVCSVFARKRATRILPQGYIILFVSFAVGKESGSKDGGSKDDGSKDGDLFQNHWL